MSKSLPSREIYAVNVPEIRGFAADFRYNFFVPDESVSETGGVPSIALVRPSADVDASFIQFSVTRVPRLVVLSFSLPRFSDPGNMVSDTKAREVIFESKSQNGSLIADNIDKVVTEDHFSSDGYVAVGFHDGELDSKIYQLVSGSYVQHTLEESADPQVAPHKAAARLHALVPRSIKPHFLRLALDNTLSNHGTTFTTNKGRPPIPSLPRQLSSVVTNMQVNTKLFHDVVNRTIKDPSSPFTTDLHSVQKLSGKLQLSQRQRQTTRPSELDYKTFVPFISVQAGRMAQHRDHSGGEIVGYIIDKVELLDGGQTVQHPPIIIDNPRAAITADFRVKYGSMYSYSCRSVAQFTVQAIDDDTGDVATVKVLVSSKPSQKAYVKATEDTAPPPPTDLNFTWDFERVNPSTCTDIDPQTSQPDLNTGAAGSLLVHWTFPPNSQRDIKKFQLFRRKTVDEAFELIKMYDFDDSAVKMPDNEDPDQRLVEYLTSPCTFLFDDDFLQGSRYIYAAAAIDAHGFTSNYSAQFEVWFDPFQNQLQKRLISHTGAPKPYPNLYLEADTFVNTIRTSGPTARRVKLYFNPEFYHLIDDNDRLTQVHATKQTGGSYRLQFLNLDNQKGATVDVTINDLITARPQTIAFPAIELATPKRPQIKVIGQ